MTVLQIVFPLTLVKSSVLMLVDSIAAGSVHLPLAVVDISLGMNEPPFPTGTVKRPVTDVLGTVRPAHCAESVSEIADPLSLINAACFVLVGRSFLSFSQWVIPLCTFS